MHVFDGILEIRTLWDGTGMTNTATDHSDFLDIAELRRTPTVSVERAGQFLGVSRSTSYEMVRSGRLPVIELGVHRKKVPSTALLRMLGYDPS